MKFLKYSLVMLLALVLVLPSPAQKKKKKKGKGDTPTEKEDKTKKISEEVKDSKQIDGLFTFYQDTATGRVDMVIKQEQIGKEFIHFYYIENGALESGAFRGQFRGSRIFTVEKYFNKIRLVVKNTSSYFNKEDAISKAALANMSDAVIYSTDISAGSEAEGAYLIAVDKLFLSDAFGFIKPPSGPKPNPRAFNLGRLSSDKTTYDEIRNYPENSDIVIDYVYENSSPKNFGTRATVDARNVTIKAQHSLIEVPDNDFQPRRDDPRVGYFTQQIEDMNDQTTTPYRDLINRWYLEKKDPEAELSEPVEPIVWWIENTTPMEIRPIIEKAGLQWNLAFEKAGFKNAVVIKTQPDDADWDAGDIRYNVLRWTASPNRAFGGYGPSFANPRTGQILGADIMLEYSVLGNANRNGELFETAALMNFEDHMVDDYFAKHNFCNIGEFSNLQYNFGLIAADAFGEEVEAEKTQILEDFLYFLILHEMGHTLGLNHNMKSSQLHDLTAIHNKPLTEDKGLTGSVMDYPSINYNKDRSGQGLYYTKRPGPYDLWAIEFGYKPVSDEEELETILARSTEPALAFGNDADDMRSPGKAIDPRVNVGDMTSNAVDYAIQRIDLTNDVMDELLDKYMEKEGQSYNELLIQYLIVTGQQYQAVNTVSRYIGGVYVDRGFVGQEGASMPYKPVSAADQKKAMKSLSANLFAPNAFKLDSELFSYLQRQRRGFNFYSATEDPKLHARYLNMQRGVLRHLLHPNVMNRMVDSRLYGNQYDLSAMMTELNDAIFAADASGSVNSLRQNLQIEYVNQLIGVIGKNSNSYLHNARSMALYNLNKIRTIASRNTGDVATKAHRQHLALLIDKALETN